MRGGSTRYQSVSPIRLRPLRWRKAICGYGEKQRSQMREIRRGMEGESVPCTGERWQTRCSTIECLDMCFMRYVSWRKTSTRTWADTSRHSWLRMLRSRGQGVVGGGEGRGTHWGVGPAAHAAAVGLGVFDGVRGQVGLQWGGVWVGTETVGAFERLVFVVLPLVRLFRRGKGGGQTDGQKIKPVMSRLGYGFFPDREGCSWSPAGWRAAWRPFHSLDGHTCRDGHLCGSLNTTQTHKHVGRAESRIWLELQQSDQHG